MKLYIILSLMLLNFLLQAQDLKDNEAFFPRENKHQMGIGASQFVKVVFNSDESAYTINYRYKYNTEYALRLGVNYFSDSHENGSVEAGLKVGLDKTLKVLKHWEFYYGADLLTKYENFKSSNKQIYKIGVGPLLGIAYYMGPHFSLSIEPLFLIEYNVFIDNSSFGNQKNESFKLGFKKVGLISLNFHF